MNPLEYKTGAGYDVHRLVPGRKLILGGKDIPFDLGLEGHSDADVLVHAVCDALLGALGSGDIGEHFPDTDPAYKGISSLALLEKCRTLMDEKGYELNNLDCIVFAQAPRLSPYKKEMEDNMAGVLKADTRLVNVKATTTEGLGFIGKGEGIAAQCTLLLRSKS
ncbi:MAG: 2-C-methyl-D-erythritol 2,4-cyclodiphosphate synthase [Desulfobacterales bacterium RIFOXYA12_FULL_46_15]|nr:MAG: 2-C-methyl-D-erythritol 2,4-cyclodiphosphate synthase [Desulfobacula sp. GWF2_41_7]OGR27902.1 MAG: 2-C-methyl-D-erythritol 2,4-cyclodiphosphate synthase [Desulfobacterales bacterium RIFOXYA12_FULL_46_15]